jgi:uncharacterized membrane protein
MKRPDHLDLLVVALGSILAAAMAALAAPLPVRVPIGLIAALVLPGYSVGMVLFPPGDLDPIERAGLAFTLSLGIIIGLAPIINVSPAGLSAEAMVGAVTAITLVAAGLAWLRRTGRAAARPLFRFEPRGEGSLRAAVRPWMGAALGLVAVLFVALLVSGVAAQSRNATEFFLIGPDGTVGGLPVQVTTGTPTSVTLGIANAEDADQAYQIVVESQGERLSETPPILVGAGKTWTGDVDFTVGKTGSDQGIQILLYKDSSTAPYRSLKLNVEAIAPAQGA